MSRSEDLTQRPCHCRSVCDFIYETTCVVAHQLGVQRPTSLGFGLHERFDGMQQELLGSIWPNGIEAHRRREQTSSVEE